MAKSLSSIKKELGSHMDFIANHLHSEGVSVAVLDAYKTSLKSVKKADALPGWLRGYSKRLGEIMAHHPQSTALINDQRKQMERIVGVQR